MDQYTCPLCGGKLKLLTIETHEVPRDQWYARPGYTQVFQLASRIIGMMQLPHEFRLGNDPVRLYACDRCGYVKAIKIEGEK